jgi:signal transduction histidine kinase
MTTVTDRSPGARRPAGSVYALDATVPRYPRRFRGRVIRSIMAIALLAAGAAFGYSFLRQSAFLKEDRRERGMMIGQAAADGAELAVMSKQPGLLASVFDRVLALPNVRSIEVYRAEGDGFTLLGRRSRVAGSGRDPAPAPDLVSRLKAAKAPLVIPVERGAEDEFLAAVLVPNRDEELTAFAKADAGPVKLEAHGYVRVTVSHGKEAARQQEMLRQSAYLAGGLLGLGFLLALIIGWRLSRPILALAAGADAIRQGNLDVQVDIRSQDEVGQLADSFNRMAWKLKNTLDQMEHLNRNLEHEVAARTADIQVSAEFVKLLNARRDLGPLVSDALRALVERTGAAFGALYLTEADGGPLTLQSTVGLPVGAFGEPRVAPGVGPVGQAAARTAPLVVTGVADDDPLARAFGGPLGMIVYQPIRFGDTGAGVVLLGASAELPERLRDLVSQAANPLAIAIANARALQSAERLARELEVRNVELTRRAELLAEQKAKLEEMNRLKSELMANITHELRTPLNAVIGYTELMLEGVYGPVNPEQHENLQAIDESARGLLDLITQILDMAKMDAGQMSLVVSEVSLPTLLADVLQTAQVLARDRPIAVGLRLPDGPLGLRTDEGKLRQILNNLVSNAIKFTEQGRVDLVASRLPDGSCQIGVRDTGIGIRPEDHEVIFEQFRQIDGSSTRQAGGTGLGLTICRRFARLMGGDVRVVSELGKGSLFSVHLPARPPEAATAVDAGTSGARLDDLSATLGLGGSSPPPAETPLEIERNAPPAGRQSVSAHALDVEGFSLSLLDDDLGHGRK